jgi:hypothetical protein
MKGQIPQRCNHPYLMIPSIKIIELDKEDEVKTPKVRKCGKTIDIIVVIIL